MIRTLTLIAAAVYFAALGYLTLSPVHAAARFGTPINLVPLRSISDQLSSPAPLGHKVIQLAGNSVLLVPFGLLLAAALPKRRWGVVVLASVAASAAIEILQWGISTGRSVDVDDVLLNSLGSILGFWLGALVLDRSGIGMGYLRRSASRRTPVPSAA